VAAEALIQRASRATVWTLFASIAKVRRDRTALVDARRTWTYGELADRASRLAGMLAARGIGRGDRIALTSENRGELSSRTSPYSARSVAISRSRPTHGVCARAP